MNLCSYGCGQEALYRFKNGKWCCSEKAYNCSSVNNKQGSRTKESIIKQLETKKSYIRVENSGIICEYGCGKEAEYQFKNGKWCCRESCSSCSNMKKINSEILKIKAPWKDKNLSIEHKRKIGESNKGKITWITGKFHTLETKDKMIKNHKGMTGKTHTEESKEKIRNKHKGKILTTEHKNKIRVSHLGKEPWNKGIKTFYSRRSIKEIKNRYFLFYEIEEMRYNPDKPIEEKEIQVHCKYNECKNSKEKGGWFTPTSRQIEWRIFTLEKEGKDNGYFYCSDECKNSCSLYNYKSMGLSELPYTFDEYEVWKQQVKILDNNKCQICETTKDIHVHHIIPKKLEPFFALDPVNGICLCKKCHYKYGHSSNGCKTNDIAKHCK